MQPGWPMPARKPSEPAATRQARAQSKAIVEFSWEKSLAGKPFPPTVFRLLTRGRGRPRHTSVLTLGMVTLSARIIAATAARESLMNKSVTVLLLVILVGATALAKKDKSTEGADL